MSGYKAGYSEEHSPTYKAGIADANEDASMVGSCPPLPPIGPVQDGAMYMRGYKSVPQVPHKCTERCKK